MQNATPVSTFRMNTCKSVAKQRTLTTFRINTQHLCKKGEGVGLFCVRRHMRHVTSLSPVPSLDCAYFLSPQGCTGPKSQKPPHFSLRARCLPAAPALCFHILTNPLAGNPFIFTSMHTPGGVGWSVLIRKWRQSPKLRSPLASATIQIRQFPCSIPQALTLVSAHQGPRESGCSTGHKLNAHNPRVPPLLP